MSETINVWVYPTRSCNFSCAYCYENHEPGFMSTEVAERTVEWAFSQASLAGAPGVAFHFFGGEPLLGLGAFKRIILYAREVSRGCGSRAEFRVNTNGSLIDDRLAMFLAENDVALDLSLDGDKDTNDSFRKTRGGGSAYEAVGGVERVARLRDLGISVSVNMVVGPDTVDSLSRNVSFFWQYGIEAVQALPMFDGGTPWTEGDLQTLDRELERVTAGIILGVLEERKMDLLKFNPFAKVIRLIRASEDPVAAEKNRQETYCGIGRRTFSVNVNGNLYSCPRFVHEARINRADPNLVVGNVGKPVYNLPVVQRFKQWNPRKDPRSICSSCEYALTCIYQCVGENLAWNGDEYAVHPTVCHVSAIVHKYAFEMRKVLQRAYQEV